MTTSFSKLPMVTEIPRMMRAMPTFGMIGRRVLSVARSSAVGGVMLTCLAGCSALDVSNPNTILDKTLDNASGANNLATTARLRFAEAISAAADQGGLLADEFFLDINPIDLWFVPYVDKRAADKIDPNGTIYDSWQRLRRDATVAVPRLKAYVLPGSRESQVGEMYAYRGYAALQLGSDYCAGFPLHEVVNFTPVYGLPLTAEQVFTNALAQFDTALTYAVDSVRIRNFARVGKARALLALGRYAEAGMAAHDVSDGFSMSIVPTSNPMRLRYESWRDAPVRTVADREGINGMDFVSAADPRVAVTAMGHARWGDTTMMLYSINKYTSQFSPIVVASDVEARLIEAEASINAHTGTWLAILNNLRQTHVTPALAPLSDPGTFDAQVDLLFRERAFWLFATGHRLGDLRRLVFQYGRDSETIFPSGAHRVVGNYGTAIGLPFRAAAEKPFSPTVTGCTSR